MGWLQRLHLLRLATRQEGGAVCIDTSTVPVADTTETPAVVACGKDGAGMPAEASTVLKKPTSANPLETCFPMTADRTYAINLKHKFRT